MEAHGEVEAVVAPADEAADDDSGEKGGLALHSGVDARTPVLEGMLDLDVDGMLVIRLLLVVLAALGVERVLLDEPAEGGMVLEDSIQ